MATFHSAIPGAIIRGKVGNTVFRYKGGKQYVSNLPKRRRSSLSETEVRNRQIFSETAMLAKAIAQADNADKVWLKKGSRFTSAYNAVFSNLYNKVTLDNIQESFNIYPDYPDFSHDTLNLEMSEEKVSASASFKKLKKCVTSDFKYMQMTVIIINRYPLKEFCEDAKLITWNSELVDIEKNGKAKFSLNIMGSDKNSDSFEEWMMKNVRNYIEHHVFAAFILLDKDMNHAGHSDTFCFYFETD